MNGRDPFISICIPAYKRPENIVFLLQSIAKQTFTDFEIVITDDSPDDSVALVLQKYNDLPIQYYKNPTALGTPANWNAAIKKASGTWIKIMHDDDWFAGPESLQHFVNHASGKQQFIFSSYYTVVSETGFQKEMTFPKRLLAQVFQNPMLLLARNIVGPPSVTLVHRSVVEEYDVAMKWRVDIDYYVRLLMRGESFTYIPEPLINVGISNSQVTNYCIDHPEVELPEGLLLLQKFGVRPLQHILVFDAWWRLLRNSGVRHERQLGQFTTVNAWPPIIFKMIRWQKRVPTAILKSGLFSKLLMGCCYLFNRRLLQ